LLGLGWHSLTAAGCEFYDSDCTGRFISGIHLFCPTSEAQRLANYALGASYIALPWWAGHVLFGDLNWKIAILTLILQRWWKLW